jgi:hypothetical protein
MSTELRHVGLVYAYSCLSVFVVSFCEFVINIYRGADKSLATPTSPCILFDGENISFDASLVIYVNSTNIPPSMIINRIYETQSSVAVDCFLPGRAKDLSAPLYMYMYMT